MSDSPLRTLARRAGLGRLLRVAYHTPVGRVRASILEGGPLEQRRTERGCREMVEAARRLPEIAPPEADDGWEVHYLTGAKYW
ncbi:MAG: hypothetical protein WBA11_16755, partial [Rubrivirga sp.]